jgi:hypothetical protein
VVRSNHNKMEKTPNVAVQKPNSLYHHANEVDDVITTIFIETDIERPNPPFLLVVVGEEE